MRDACKMHFYVVSALVCDVTMSLSLAFNAISLCFCCLTMFDCLCRKTWDRWIWAIWNIHVVSYVCLEYLERLQCLQFKPLPYLLPFWVSSILLLLRVMGVQFGEKKKGSVKWLICKNHKSMRRMQCKYCLETRALPSCHPEHCWIAELEICRPCHEQIFSSLPFPDTVRDHVIAFIVTK